MKKLLVSDNSLKIWSVVIAIFIWIYIAIIMDPAIEVSVRDIPIQFVGQQSLETRNLAVISESATSVSIKIKGSRKKMGNNDMKTIIARADVSALQRGQSSVPVEIVIPFENQGITHQSHYTVDVKTEPISEKTLDVKISTTGSLASSYMFGDIKATPAKVTVRGASSAVDKIASAGAELDLGGADVDIDTELPIIFYNENGKVIPSLDAILKRVTAFPDKVEVHCPVVKIREIKPSANFGRQSLPDDFSYEINPSVLYIYSENPGSINVDKIMTEEISIDKLLENEKVKARLVIPENIKILYDISEVEISVKD